MELTFDQIRKYWEIRHPGQRVAARERVSVCCVLHGEDNPSCTLYLDGNGGFNCHACGAKGNLFQFEMRFSSCTVQQAEINVAEVTGARPSTPLGDLGPPVAFYDYRDENAKVLYQKRRYEPEMGRKTFLVFRSTDRGFSSKIDPPSGAPTRRVLYNLPALIKANLVCLTEGEKDADNLAAASLFTQSGYSIACTSTYDGAWQKTHSPKWLDTYNPYFTGKLVFIFADNDEPGRLYAETAAQGIAKYAYQVRVVYFDELPEHGDVSDYLEMRTVGELEVKMKSAPQWTGKVVERANWLVEAVEWSKSSNPEIDWVVNGIVQRYADGLIAAEPKTGKSLCALDMLLSISCGLDWLGRATGRRTRTAYISREDSPTLTKARLVGLLHGKGIRNTTQFLIDAEGWLWCNTREQLSDFSIDDDEHLANMAHDLKERGVEFAVIDVFNRIHHRAENDNAEMAAVFGRISEMGREAGCNLGIVHHVNKENSSGRFFTRIRGASSIHGWTEWSIGLSIVNPNSDGDKLVRKAEFETKAGEECSPIEFTFESDQRGSLSLRRVVAPTPEEKQKEQRQSWQQRYQ